MKVQILEYVPDSKGMKIGELDVQVFYPGGKDEIFRGLVVFRKPTGKASISFGRIKRGEKWIARYERNPYPKEFFDNLNEAFYEFTLKNPALF